MRKDGTLANSCFAEVTQGQESCKVPKFSDALLLSGGAESAQLSFIQNVVGGEGEGRIFGLFCINVLNI